MRARRYIRTIIALLILLLYGGTEIWAADVTVVIDNGIINGTVTSSVATRVVTLTVTPNDGYYLKASDIVVEPLVGTERANASTRRPVPGTAEPIVGTLYNDATEREASNIINSILGTNSAYYVFTVPEDYDGVYVTATFTATSGEIVIPSGSSITYDQNGHYILVDDISASDLAALYVGSQTNAFAGVFEGVAKADGTFPKITGLTTPLFSTINGGTVKNIMLESVAISQSDIVGAICGTAQGATRIYNCGILSGSVGSTGGATDSPKTANSCGGLVGLLDGTSRVINCFSYATITGGNRVGGIVGYNNATTTATSIKTMVMNCMFYGDITGGNKVSPVYGGNNISNLPNTGLNTFNYYSYEELKTKQIDFYNCALAVENKYLTRFEFYRLLLNSNKKLAAKYVTNNPEDANIMAKWVLETADRSIANPKPYPILKAQGKYPSIINYDTENAPVISLEDGKPVEGDRNKGGKMGTLSVTIRGVGSNAPSGAAIVKGLLSLDRTDKDPDRFNFNYDKVQLPYYNDVGTGNYTGNKVVTGWKITAITAVADDPYTSSNYDYTQTYSSNKPYFDFPNYNFADRKSSNKDLYSVSGRVFSQGAYFDVPYGVTSITIEPYWANAAYVADEYYDVVYNKNDNYTRRDVSELGKQVDTGTELNGQTIHTTISSALTALGAEASSGSTVYDKAIVLVGNLHQNDVPSTDNTAFTIMSADLDHDNEPDYSMIYHHKNRQEVCPIRFDFLNIPGTAQVQKPYEATVLLNFTIFKTKGWFELTNTSLAYSNQVEYEWLGAGKSEAPLILLGGIFEQFVSTQSSVVPGKTIYIHVGGNVCINSFGLGTHSDGNKATPHVPVSVTGGEYEGFYLTGTYNPNAGVSDDNAECYISGGHFVELAGACQEQIGNNTTENGNVHWQIYNADIDNFYGGGINDAKPVKGNITTDIFNSYVTTFCGGPKFGNMASGKTVTTNAEGCTFRRYFGGGFGGNSYSRKKYYDHTSYNWNTLQGYYTTDKGKYFDGIHTNSKQSGGASGSLDQYGKKGPGVAVDFDYEFFVWSTGTTGARMFVKFASFSLAQCGDVSSNLKGCTITENFYGGGSLGKVIGTATSVLDGCTVLGNVFGGGYSADLPTIPVRDAGFNKNPNFNSASGMFEPGVYSGTTEYTWKQVESFPSEGGAGFDGEQVITTVDLTSLGQVGHTDLTIKGETHVAGNVFGGGDESAVLGNTKVDIQNSATSGLGYVYGGGNTADVNGNAVVTMTGGTVINNVFGGGKGQTTVVGGDVTVNIGSKSDAEPPVYSGKATVSGNVYGGSALGNVNATKGDGWTVDDLKISGVTGKTTHVNLYGGTVTGSVFGGGLGQRAADAVGTEGEPGYVPAQEAIASNVYGPVTVTVEGSATGENVTAFTAGNVFGCNDQNGAPQQTVEVFIHGTAAPSEGTPNPIGNVYGGGNLAAYTAPEGTPNYPVVTMMGGTVGNVYGGGLGASAVVTGNPSVSISGGTVNQDVYGGGSQAAVTGATSVTLSGGTVSNDLFGGGKEANVTGSVAVSITGGTVTHDVYGGGALANTNTATTVEDEKTVYPNTTISLTGGTIDNVYGGGLGRKGDSPVAATSGNVLVELNEGVANAEKGCIVNKVFGCNDSNGTPKGNVTVHVYGTQNRDASKSTVGAKFVKDNEDLSGVSDVSVLKGVLSDKIKVANAVGIDIATYQALINDESATAEAVKTSITAITTAINTVADTDEVIATINNLRYDVRAVYGGGNEAAYDPDSPWNGTEGSKIQVIIEGCEETSIETVYGGGNAAAVPETNVEIRSAYEIGTVFGGGNGKDDLSNGDPNPGADVGCKNHDESNTYGTGDANTSLQGGYIHEVYGGSNQKGTIIGNANVISGSSGECTLTVGKIYGGGKNADMSGGTNIVLGCMPDGWIDEIYAGAQAAGVGNVSLTITSGKFGRVFGGNKDTGKLEGSITVNIEETGDCGVPIVIGELYAGGNQADYSIYGYNDDGTVKTSGETPYANPQLNVRAFTSIGAIYGGGYSAQLVGNPSIDVNVVKGSLADNDAIHTGEGDTYPAGNTGGTPALPYPAHKKGEIGAIGNVFGGGNLANVIGNTAINIGTAEEIEFVSAVSHLTPKSKDNPSDPDKYEVAGANITGNIYGGGNAADIIGNTTITIGTVDLTAKDGTTIAGNVFGGGLGATTTVTGNVEVNIGKRIAATESTPESYVGYATISRDIYGGSAKGKVNATKSGTAPVTYSESSGTTQVNLYGGTIVGNLYGGGYGLDDAEADVYGTVMVNMYGGTVPNVFGGNNLSGVTRNTVEVKIAGGTVSQNVYGGGNAADALDDVTVRVTGGAVTHDVYGGGKGQTTVVGGDVKVNIGAKDGEGNLSGSGTVSGNVYGGSALGAVNAKKDGGVVYSGTALDPKVTAVNIYGGTVTGSVFGGGLGEDDVDPVNDIVALSFGDVAVTMEGGTVTSAVYGGSNINGVLKGSSTVTIAGGTIHSAPGEGDPVANVVFGGGFGEPTRVEGDVTVNIGSKSDTEPPVYSGTATVHGSVYGGSAKGTVNAYDNSGTLTLSSYPDPEDPENSTLYRETHVNLYGGTVNGALYGGGYGKDDATSATYSADVYGAVTVTTKGSGTAQDVFGCNNVSGTPRSTVAVAIDGGTIGNVYGGGKDAPYTSTPTVTMSNGTVTNVYGGGLGATADTGGSSVTISGGTVNNDVYGGGSMANVTGSVSVSITGGTIVNDVYGGGALANTNTGNWNSTTETWNVADATPVKYYVPVKHLKVGQSDVYGYYTDASGSSQVTVEGTKAAEGTTYYKELELNPNIYNIIREPDPGDATIGHTTYTTSVSATGGVIGNIYGGGLGQLGDDPVAAMVYGDVTVTVDGAAFSNELVSYNYTAEEAIAYNAGLTGALGSVEPLTTDQASAYNAVMQPATPKVEGNTLSAEEAATYNAKLSGAVSTSDTRNVAKTGRVFGCNNLNGTPKGKVLVQVNQTVREDGGTHTDDEFEILAVYGGGNAAVYEPKTYDIDTEFGQHTRVVIDGCTEVSIEKVYGGGNAADVPFTDVLIEGAFQIGYVFGGGNGGDRLYYNDSWHDNLGANVTGYANVLTRGGTIGQIFGGSDTRGAVGGAETTREAGTCPLNIVNWYGAGNGEEATSDGDIIVNVSGCGAQSSIKKVFGGSYKANIKGSITLNITSGVFTSVYGGNDRMGSIGGNITVNVEETESCETPIIIQNLFGGCYETPYPGANASTYDGVGDKSSPSSYTPFTRGKITVNVKAATRIDRVYGGSYKAGVNGDTEVNINMTKGSRAGQAFELPEGYRGNPIPNIHGVPKYGEVTGLTYLPDENASSVDGLFTKDGDNYIPIEDPSARAQEGVTYYEITELIGTIDNAIGTIGNVYGGGYQGVVNGDAVVNVGSENELHFESTVSHLTPSRTEGEAPDPVTKYYAVLGANIKGDVFGGGNRAEVTGNTYVNIYTKQTTPILDDEDKPTGAYNHTTTDFSGITGFEGVSIGESVYGGGNEADVLKNTFVTMAGGYVYDGVYGGGLRGSVGTLDKTAANGGRAALPADHPSHDGCVGGKPEVFLANTGKCTVTISGGQVGPREAALAAGGMKNTGNLEGYDGGPVDVGFVFGAGRGEVENPQKTPDADFLTYVKETDVTISGGLIMASVYGGGENGRVRGNTHVKISGGQIGCGEGSFDGSGNPVAYDDGAFFNPIGKTEDYINDNALPACSHWDFEDPYAVFDPYATESGNYYEGSASSTHPTDGKTYYGCVFGGGSGYYPYVIEEDGGTVKKYEWLRSAGWVEGNTLVDITGGHILTNIYGGNEYTDVGTEGVAGTGKCTINFGGTATLGVPRTLAQIKAHPVICYLFGSGKGDPRTHFNTWTNVNEVEVNVTGGIIYGSVFGGGEDAHVLGNTEVNISGTAKIGTWGTSYVDGNVFGGGRGFDGKALTAGSVGGNVDVNITGGTMLGSVYGGGRLASVGIPFVSPTLGDGVTPNPNYGLLRDETGADGDPTYGHVTVDISGGIIGGGIAGSDPTTSDIRHSGNVFGGSMGRNTLLSGSLNPLWPKLAVVKLTDVTIHGTADIKRSVYGGGELGIVRNQATVNVSGGTVRGSVFGGGYGSIDDSEASKATITAGGYDEIPTMYYTFTPMIWNGCVSGNTFVNVSGGKIYNNVYGGGEYASVGLINFNSNEGGTVYNYITKHDEPTEGFALSWPYEFQYIQAAPNDASTISGRAVGGKATINISGGRIGIEDGDDTNGEGDVYGGSKGVAGDSYKYAFCANVKETEVNIIYPTTPDAGTGDGLYTVEYDTEEKEWQDGLADKDDDDTDLILGSVYGGGENGHVMDDTNVNMEGGLIGHALYGGGKGKDKYSQTLKKSITPAETYTANSYSITAGKVYGNTNITMTGGHVIRNIYGGGNMASVGKGNYAIGSDDFLTESYGETAGGDLWTSSSVGDNAWHFLHSGKATVSVTGGTVGFENSQKDDLPTGNIYGGCRGRAAAEVTGIDVNPEFYVGYVNETDVSIGDGSGSPTILGSVYGGGQDGHVRRETHVTVNNGEIGVAYDGASGDNVKALKKAYDHDTNKTLTSDELAEFAEPTHFLWIHRGNVYGGGSGIAKYKFDYNGDGDTDDNDGSLEYYDNPVKEKDFSSSAGSVTHSTTVEIKGGTVHRNVYGGGSLASVIPAGTGEGPYRDESHGKGKKSLNMVSISGGTIGDASSHDAYGYHVYGGEVYGASRGESHDGMNNNYFALASGTEVNILADNTPVVYGSVYGGGELGRVQKDTQVNLLGGTVKYDAYGGGKGTVAVAANVGGNATVELNKPSTTLSDGETILVPTSARGCVVNRIFGCNNINGSPQGHVKVHIHRTQNALKSKISEKFPLYHKYTPTDYADVLDDFVTIAGSDHLNITGFPSKATLTTAFAGYNDKQKQDAVDSYKAQLSAKYDVQYVYGGGNLAMYLPKEEDLATEFAEVIIDGCKLTSIKTVYGGGNAASTPANSVTVWGTYEIDELFGGGNGKDDYLLDGEWYQNPGADVGYRDMTYFVRNGETGHDDDTHGTGTSSPTYDPYKSIIKAPPTYTYDAGTKEGRQKADYPTGYKYGAGSANTMVYGGYVHIVYGGSNEKGNIRSAAVSTYEEKSDCPLKVDYSYGAGKNAIIDGDVSMVMDCVENIDNIYGGSTNADVLSDINLKITNGSFKKVFGGNNTDGAIYGSITVDIEERGCQPIYIEELYSGGYLAPYSVYGYKKTGGVYDRDANGKLIPLKSVGGDPLVTQAHHDPCVNVISATRIDNIYGGGYKAAVIGSPHVNVNMTNGKIISSYVASKGIEVGENTDAKGNKFMVERIDGDAILAIGTIGTIFGGGNEADIIGNTYVDIGTGEWLNAERQREMLGTTDDILTPTTFTYNATSEKWEYVKKTTVTDPGTGEETETTETIAIDGKPTPARNAATITGSVYGGGKMGHVGDFTFDEDGTNDIPDGKPISCTEGTGTCYVTVSNGSIGPDNMQMFHLVAGDYPADDKPDDSGHVFGGCQGTLDYYYDDTTGKTEAEKLTGMLALGATTEARNAAMNAKVGKLAFCDATNVTINGMAWVKGSVFGGPENGHVLHNTNVNIADDCQIGNGHILRTDGSGTITANRGVNRRYTAKEWENGHLFVDDDPDIVAGDAETALVTAASTQFDASLPECAAWLYGATVSGNRLVTNSHHAPYDKFADAAGYDEDGGLKIATSGRSFYGSVFAGGSGYFPYAPGHWLETAGEVEGNATVTVTGGHILTSLYGGNEMSSVLGDTYVTMSGGTVGVPRTLDEIDAHPVTCYVFGGGKGESRPMLNNDTNVKNTNVTISGGWVYGSVFGGAEDGHVIEDANVTIEGNPVDPSMTPAEAYAAAFAGTVTKIGTWGTSYVDGNIFGGGRGFDGHNVFAGCVEGNVNISISGGEMLGSVYGGGRLGSVGINNSGEEMDDVEDDESTPSIDETKRHGHITVNISGGTIGNNDEYPYVYKKVKAADDTEEGNWETVRANIPHTEFYEGYSDFKEKIADEAIDDAPDGSSTVITEEAYGEDETTYTYKSCGLKKVFQSKGGNVFAGGMGRLTKLSGDINPNWDKLGQAKTTELIISQASDAVPTIIKGSIFGGAEFGQVKGNASINITGGSIGTEIQHNGVTQYTYGTVFGGGYGSTHVLTAEEIEAGVADPRDYAGLVTGNTTVSMSAGVVKSSVYGGGKLAQTGGNTNVTISGGRIGLNKVRKGDGYVMYGGSTMGNVYGSGRGDVGYTKAGLVKGNTNVTISPSSTVDGEPFIAHNVYGGGSLASVGTFTVSDGTSYTPLGVPVANSWVDGTGVATVSITGGTIGISGRDNGMVCGSSRGDVDVPVASKLFGLDVEKDPYDKMAWVKQSIVNIGSSDPGAGAGPHIKGSVYGGGENGHNEDDATVNIYSGIIGIVDKDDLWYDFDDADVNDKAKITRGNVYGAGCGTDIYKKEIWTDANDNGVKDDGEVVYEDTHNSWAGCVIGNTYVNIYGGHVTHNVYGGGSLGSVGALYYDPDQKDGSGNYLYKHEDKTKGFALSWPYHIHYENGGTTNVTITGGRIGTTGSDNGDVFGGTRGEAGDRYTMANIGNVQNTVVNISYSSTPGDDKIEAKEKIDEDDGLPKYSLKLKDGEEGVTGSVYGGGEDGHVYGNTQVNITKGFIGHAVYGGGKGKGKYKNGEGKKVYSITAGKVYGNTNVTMEGGHVLRNVYGGGNLGSIGKGNYAGGSDDIYPSGYGESLNGNSGDDAKLWDKTANDNAQAFMESGIATVNVTGGIVGFMPQGALDVIPMEDGSATTFDAASAELKAKVIETCSKDNLPTGNIFGGARGQATAEIESLDDLDPNVNPNFFLGYVNETDVTVGDGNGGPRIYGSVYGGGQDGHVRRGTDVTINKGEIGVPYDADEETPVYTAMFGTDLDNLHWLHRGNVYGGGSGIGTYKEDEVQKDSPSAGSVTHTTNVTVANSIKGVAGTQDAPGNVIYRNVYGGGSRASVCPPAGVEEAWLDDTHGIGKKVVNTVNISGAVGVLSGYVERYGGEVYGASRGDIKEGMDPAFFAVSVWTQVNILNGATIMGNVFGGGDSGKVLKDTEVNIGEEATP